MVAIAFVKLRPAPIAARKYFAALRFAAMTFPGRGRVVIGFPPHGQIGGDFLARFDIPSRGDGDLVNHPDIRVAGVIGVIVHTVSLFNSMSQNNTFGDGAVTMFHGLACLDVFRGEERAAPDHEHLSFFDIRSGKYAHAVNGRWSRFKARVIFG